MKHARALKKQKKEHDLKVKEFHLYEWKLNKTIANLAIKLENVENIFNGGRVNQGEADLS